MTAASKPILLVYGNCQAGALSHFFRSDPVIALTYDVRYFPSFDDRVAASRDLTEAELDATKIFFEQVDPNVFRYRDGLPSQCTTVTFPSIDLNLLWPLSCTNVYNDAPTPERPWGSFPMGDRIIVDCVQRGLSAAETLAYYETQATRQIPDLNRYAKLEKARLAAREATADVKMSDVVFDRLASENIFWSVNHPTMTPLKELCRRLLAVTKQRIVELDLGSIDHTLATLPPDGPLGFLRVPIHPVIVDFFNLEWYRAQEGANYGLRYEAPLTYEHYFQRMTEVAVTTRDAQREGFAAQALSKQL